MANQGAIPKQVMEEICALDYQIHNMIQREDNPVVRRFIVDHFVGQSHHNQDRVYQSFGSGMQVSVQVSAPLEAEGSHDAARLSDRAPEPQLAGRQSDHIEEFRAQLPNITRTLTAASTGAGETARIDNLFLSLCQMEKVSLVIKKENSESLGPEPALGVIELVFDQCFQDAGLKQLHNLCSDAAKNQSWRNEILLPHGHGDNFEPGIPVILQNLFRAYKLDDDAPSGRVKKLQRMLRFARRTHFYKCYEDCRRALDADEPEQELVQYLEEQGFLRRKDRFHLSNINQLLARRFEVKIEILAEKRYVGAALLAFVEAFGYGILPLLPGGVLKLCRRVLPSLMMADITGMILKAFPEIRDICDLVNEKIYNPIQNGLVPVVGFSMAQEGSFYEVLQRSTGVMVQNNHNVVEHADYQIDFVANEMEDADYEVGYMGNEMKDAQNYPDYGPYGYQNREICEKEVSSYRAQNGPYEGQYPA